MRNKSNISFLLKTVRLDTLKYHHKQSVGGSEKFLHKGIAYGSIEI